METPVRNPFLGNRFYDGLKFIALIILPALAALYFGLASIWGLPKAEEVVGTITVIDTFLGIVLGLSSRAYNSSDAMYDGVMEVSPPNEDGLQTFQLKLNDHPSGLPEKRQVSFKVLTISEQEVLNDIPNNLPEVPPL